MNLPAFTYAYQALKPSERAFVDASVAWMTMDSIQRREPISWRIGAPCPPEIAERSNGMHELLHVRNAITERLSKLANDQIMTPEKWSYELHCVAHSSMGDYVRHDEYGVARFDTKALTPEQWRAVKKLKIKYRRTDDLVQEEVAEVEIELYGKLEALKMEGQYMGLLEAENPAWKQEQATRTARLAPDAPVEQVADEYQRVLEG